MIIHGEQINVNDKSTNKNPATLLSTPSIIVPKSKPQVMQKLSDDELVSTKGVGVVMDTLVLENKEAVV